MEKPNKSVRVSPSAVKPRKTRLNDMYAVTGCKQHALFTQVIATLSQTEISRAERLLRKNATQLGQQYNIRINARKAL